MKPSREILLGLLSVVAIAGCSSSSDPSSDAAPASASAGGSPNVGSGVSGSGGASSAAQGSTAGARDVGAAPSVGNGLGSLGVGVGATSGAAADAGVAPDGGGGTSATGVEDGGLGTGGTGETLPCSPPASGSIGTNPLFTDQFSADPGPFVHDCTFYIQCGHDDAAPGQNAFVMREWFLLASTDLVHWTKNVALRLSDFAWANANAWAGQMVTKGGKFYWYVPVQEASTGAMAIGVAVADSPTGPFTDALGRPLINDAFEMSNVGFPTPGATPYTIDPTVLVDDDGQAYLHYGSFGRMMAVRLNDDMISIDGVMQEGTPQGFFEAPFLTKRNGVYYEIYAAGQNPASIDYATSNGPLGPWTRRGRVLDAFPTGAGQNAPTNHAGVAEFAGQWYIVYHVSDGPNGGGTYRREVAIDRLNFNADDTIQRVVPSTGLTF